MASKSSHAGLGVALGAALGAIAGVLAGHIAIWLGIGIAIGMVLGAMLPRSETPCPECKAIHRSHRERAEEMTVKQLQN